jgi:uncharacterized membrane protein YhhN
MQTWEMNKLLNVWLLLAIGLMAANWFAVWQQNRKLDILTKSLPVLTLAVWFANSTQLVGSALWFFFGLLFSALGDTFLLFKKLFFAGLAAFFLAHCAYLAGFNQPFPDASIPVYVLMVLFSALWIYFYGLIRKGFMGQPKRKKLLRLVTAYSLAQCLMAFSATATFFRMDWHPAAAALAACGALLFLFSDFLWAIDRFVQPLPKARIWKRVIYHLGQLAIAAGAALYFSGGIGLFQG